MKNLNNNELKEINGGANFLLWSVLGGIGLLILGTLDGLFNPGKCNS